MSHEPKSTDRSASGISRRQFVALTGAAAAGLLLKVNTSGTPAFGQTPGASGNILKGFIVSDSHFGWKDPQQPTVQKQREMMAVIMKRFPDLDFFLDTGDSHHNYATAEDRGHWTETIAGGCERLPFYFLAGNHDVDAWNYDWDPEQDSMRLGSVPCRPYFSFDCKNIHFLALPELMSASTVTDEVLAWARLDLALNRNKKVIVLSHNALAGTTVPMTVSTYRVVTNSDDVFKLLNDNPNVLAWMHGHNHDYNLVPKDNRLFVSNGRIGGFVPKDSNNEASNKLNAPLGGIYFEVHPDKFVVRCYSAEHDKFLDEMPGGASLARTMTGAMSLDATAPPAFSFGMAMMPPQTRMAVYNYHAAASSQLFVQSAHDDIINQNSALDQYSVRDPGPMTDRNLVGYVLKPDLEPKTKKPIGYTYDNPGITILPNDDADKPFVLSIPGQARGRRGYYRGAPGSKVQLEIDVDQVPAGAECSAVLNLATSDTKEIGAGTRQTLDLSKGNQTVSCTFDLPTAAQAGIYTDAESDYFVTFWINIDFRGLKGPLPIKGIRLRSKTPGTAQPVLQLGDHRFADGKTVLAKDGILASDGPQFMGDRCLATNLSGAPIHWLMRVQPTWQSRNAPLRVEGNVLHIERRRNSFGGNKEVILVPMKPLATPYVHRLLGICPAEVYLFDEQARILKVNVRKIDGSGVIAVSAASKPTKVVNAEVIDQTATGFTAKIASPGVVELHF